MRKVLTVAAREYKAAVLTKAFIIGMAMMPILMGGSIFIQIVFKDLKSVKDKRIVIIDRTPGEKVFGDLKASADSRNKESIFDKATGKQKEPKFILEKVSPEDDVLKQRYALAQQVKNDEIFAFVDIGAKVFDTPKFNSNITPATYAAEMTANAPDLQDEETKAVKTRLPDELAVRYYSNKPTYTDFQKWLTKAVNNVIQAERAKRIGLLDLAKLMVVLFPAPTTSRDLPRLNRLTGEIEDGKEVNLLASFLIPFGIVMLMFMIIMVGATPLMQGVVEEKMQKIAEVLLASVRPFELMLGKLLGGVGVSLTLGSAYLVGGMIAAWYYGVTDYFSPVVVAWFVVYLVLAVLMFGSLFVAVGAACTDIKETQSLLMPVMLLATFPLFFLTKIIQEPDGALARAISFFPFATPSIMVARIAIPPGASPTDPILGVAIVLVTTLVCVWVAGRIFRVGLLMQGKGASFAEVARWVWKG